ncbi:MAG: anhydro-N-acetylmuramic acid kinase [Ectothiorhodospiraceae bacterium]|nr:anhydro-N-acetylmuramic acid kinase [Chromatiales bacterium]MCP5153493.1 anhydro-N-acetylmuramic acid kinase [Ectothiorhodospiraceae bacterium]
MSLFVGLISGTSMDAVDAAMVEFPDSGRPVLVATHSHRMPAELVDTLARLARDPLRPAIEAWRADVEVGECFARAVDALLEKSGVGPERITAIGSHGQTVYHGPLDAPRTTVQIGDPNIIAERCGITTVADFRRRDLAAGGQAAPLVPAFHRTVFAAAGVDRAVLNLGGIANLTLLPGSPPFTVTGFDTGPANGLLDAWARSRYRSAFDRDGAVASSGRLDEPLLRLLLDEPYFRAAPPKSTGPELFNLGWLESRLAARGSGLEPEDVMRTLCDLTAATVASALEAHAPATAQVFACGGGVHNPALMAAIAARLGARRLASTLELGVDPDWVEAMAFAWLARETLAARAGNLPAVTGASGERILGGIYQA